MNKYDVKANLIRYKVIKREVEALKLRLQEVSTDLVGLGAVRYDKDPVCSSPASNNAREAALDRKAMLEEKLSVAINNKYQVEDEILKFISVLSNQDYDRDILIDYYIECNSISQLCKKYNYSKEYLFVKLSRCYKKLAEKYTLVQIDK
jgi:hypothetical protein